MREFLKNATKGLTIGIFSILGILLVVYGAGEISKLNDTKTSGSTLTLTSWNNLVNKVDELVDKVNAQPLNQGGANMPTEISPMSAQWSSLKNAIIGCKNMTSDGGGWRLPTQEELMQFVGSTGVTDTSLWTTSVFNNNIGEYIWLELYNGNWGKYSYNSGGNGYIYYRCVR